MNVCDILIKSQTSYGGLAQLGERLPCKQEVTSSNLVFSTLLSSVAALLLHYFCFIGNSKGTSYETKGTACQRCALARR